MTQSVSIQQTSNSATTSVRLDLGAVPEAAPLARAALRQLLIDGPLAERLNDAELGLSELVTNAVLHGRAPISVRMSLHTDRLHVEVHDGSTLSPSFSMLDPTAVTGRGLLLLSALADAWGVEALPTGKSVWFDLTVGADESREAADVDALLAAWGDDLSCDPALEQVRIVLTDLDTRLVARSEAHIEAVLRELRLLVGAGSTGPDQLRTAESVLTAAAAADSIRSSWRHQLSVAIASGLDLVDLTCTVRRDDAELIRDLSHALDEADRLTRAGLLLVAPAPVELSETRQSYLRRVLAQLQS